MDETDHGLTPRIADLKVRLARLARHVAVASCQRRSEADLVLDTVGDRQAEVRVEALRRFQVGVTGRIQK